MNKHIKLILVLFVVVLLVIIVSSCGEKTTNGLEFSLNPDGKSYMVFAGNSNEPQITIPSEYKRLPVTSISESAFKDCSNMTSITIPSSITNIGNYAFAGCSSLTSITIPNSVISIGIGILAGCTSLDTLTAPFKAIYNSSDNSYLRYYFEGTAYYDTDKPIPKSLKNVNIVEGTTAIADYVFNGCSNLETITIPNSVTSIGNSAFYWCSSLTNINIPDGVMSIGNNTFYGCSSLTEVIIPSSVISLGDSSFYECISLTSVTIPSSVTSIGDLAFGDCSNIGVVIIDSLETPTLANDQNINGAFRHTHSTLKIFVPSGRVNSYKTATGWRFYESKIYSLGIIDSEGFAIQDNVLIQYFGTETNLTVPSEVISLADGAIRKCSSLETITIPDSVVKIGDYALFGCSNLRSIIISDSVTSIGSYAFSETAWYNKQPDGLVYAGKVAYRYKGVMPTDTSIELLEGTKGIAGRAFDECISLTSITIPDSVINIGPYAFSNCIGLVSIDIPDNLTIIEEGVFWGCSSLVSITIPNSVTSIGLFAFSFCGSLTSITIPESVTIIGICSFYGCTSLTSITIPINVVSIGFEAFWGCNLINVKVDSHIPPSIGKGVFDYNNEDLIIYVSNTSVDAYKVAINWKWYADKIFPIED